MFMVIADKLKPAVNLKFREMAKLETRIIDFLN